METITVEQYHAGELTDMKVQRLSEKQLIKTMFDESKSPAEVVDAFEEEKGIKQKKPKTVNVKKKVRVFDLSVDRDREMYEALLNNPRYEMAMFKDSFSSVTGKYSVACHYVEDLDSDSPPSTFKEETDDTDNEGL